MNRIFFLFLNLAFSTFCNLDNWWVLLNIWWIICSENASRMRIVAEVFRRFPLHQWSCFCRYLFRRKMNETLIGQKRPRLKKLILLPFFTKHFSFYPSMCQTKIICMNASIWCFCTFMVQYSEEIFTECDKKCSGLVITEKPLPENDGLKLLTSLFFHLFFLSRYGVGSFSFASLVTGVTARFSTPAELQQVCPHNLLSKVTHKSWSAVLDIVLLFRQLEDFVEEHKATGFGSASLAVDQALERTKANMKWVQQNKLEVLDWFNSQTGH